MRAVLLIGHGSLRAGAGSAMIRLAARAREAGLAPIVGAGFLNYSRPRFVDALARCVRQGATDLVIQPYFLIPGKFVAVDLPRLLLLGRQLHPNIAMRMAVPFGDHPALAQLVLKRANEAVQQTEQSNLPIDWAPDRSTALLVMAHGSPDPSANQAIYAVAERIRAAASYATATVCFLDLNAPSIGDAIDAVVRQGIRQLIAVPYFLQLGGHVFEDLPQVIHAAQLRHSAISIIQAEHLSYDRLLLPVIADRVAEVLPKQAEQRSENKEQLAA